MENKTNILALSPEKLVDLLSRFGFPGMSVDLLQQDFDNGAPRNDDGSINLIHYMAWLIKGVTFNGNEPN